MSKPTVAVFRPDDERLQTAVATLRDRGVEPLPDPLLAIEPTGALPDTDAAYVIFTSKTGAEIVGDAGWNPGSAEIVAIGPKTAQALRDQGYAVAHVPAEYSSDGLVVSLADTVPGQRVELARSDHGRDALLSGLRDAGATVHETILYTLTRPPDAGISTERAAAGTLDAALFTSSLTVEHFCAAAADRHIETAAIDGLQSAVVGAIGQPTAQTAATHGIDVDVISPAADFDRLVDAVLGALAEQ